jgi:predicted DNA-binding helix-hairpin-helix protein
MHVAIKPDAQTRISMLGQMAEFDLDGDATTSKLTHSKADFLARSIYQVKRPDGPMTVMRTMQSSACERNCRYCAFRAGRNHTPRLSLSPDEMAACFDKMYRADIVRGLFLSSGIIGGGVKTMDPMLATAELLRQKYAYRGYLHLKIMPGAQPAQIEQALRWADRVSINLEAVDDDRLAYLAPQKNMHTELLSVIETVDQMTRTWEPHRKRPSMVTQFVVGPAGESDSDLLGLTSRLYCAGSLARAYYSGFNPVEDTPLEAAPATLDIRQHRLYQADWLLRFYGFSFEDLPFDPAGNLLHTEDPKLVWARQYLLEAPVEVNQAQRSQLLRVPGIGPRSVEAILRARRQGALRDLSTLRTLGVVVKRAAPFILMDGQRPPHQLRLWKPDTSSTVENELTP